MKQWTECLVSLFRVGFSTFAAFSVCIFHLLLKVSGVPRLTHSAGSRSCCISPLCSQNPVLGTPFIFVTGLSTGFQNPPSRVHRVTYKCLGSTPMPVSICDSPYPVTDRCGSIDTSVPSPLARGYFQAWLYVISQSFLKWWVSESLAVVAGHLTTYPFWLTLLSDWSFPHLVPTAPKHTVHTWALVRGVFLQETQLRLRLSL